MSTFDKKSITEIKQFMDGLSKDFRKGMREKGLTLEDIIQSGLEIRKDLMKEWGLK